MPNTEERNKFYTKCTDFCKIFPLDQQKDVMLKLSEFNSDKLQIILDHNDVFKNIVNNIHLLNAKKSIIFDIFNILYHLRNNDFLRILKSLKIIASFSPSMDYVKNMTKILESFKRFILSQDTALLENEDFNRLDPLLQNALANANSPNDFKKIGQYIDDKNIKQYINSKSVEQNNKPNYSLYMKTYLTPSIKNTLNQLNTTYKYNKCDSQLNSTKKKFNGADKEITKAEDLAIINMTLSITTQEALDFIDQPNNSINPENNSNPKRIKRIPSKIKDYYLDSSKSPNISPQ